MKRSAATALALSLAAVLTAPAAAGAVTSTGNLLANPGAEDGAAASNDTDAPDLAGWGKPFGNAKLVAVNYGSPGGFPAFAPVGGGGRFFAGGPRASSSYDNIHVVSQTVAFPASAQPEIDAGQVQATLSGCLGGFANQDDYAYATFEPRKADGTSVGGYPRITGPKAAERNNETKLLPVTTTATLPPQAAKAVVELDASRSGAAPGAYNDGYADKLSFSLSNTGTAPLQPDCSYPAGTTFGGGQGGGGGGSNGGGPGSLLSKVGSSATFSHGRIVVRLRCDAHDAPCKGSLSLTVPSLPAAAASVKLGSKRFTISAGKTAKVKVKPSRKVRRRLRRLSARRLHRLRVTVKARIGTSSTKFKLRLRR